MSVPRRYADVIERYRTLERHSVNIEANELQLAHSLAEKWRELYVFARTKDLRLAKVKEDFPDLTFGGIGKKLGELWRELDDEAKEKYKEPAE